MSGRVPEREPWRVEVHRGDAEAFHQRAVPEPAEPVVWWFDVDRDAIVLGSAQPIEHIDLDACDRLGVQVVRRRSGGGAVLLQPGDAMWVDVVLPTTHHRWTDDVNASAWWLGDVWSAALGSLGVGQSWVHRGAMVRTEWSAHVCFAGLGGGEVVLGGRKLVGISQRRTRAGARFQCAIHRAWRPEAHAPLMRAPGPTADELRDLTATVDIEPVDVRTAFLAALTADS